MIGARRAALAQSGNRPFFFSHLPRGTFVFEYPLFVGQAGNFSNGVTNIECMYAPEFGFHSEGIRVNVEEATP